MQRKIALLFTVAIFAAIFVGDTEAGRLRRQTKACTSFCTLQFDPVCGKSDKRGSMRTFPNRCAFNNEQCLYSDWTYVQKGECPYQG